MVNSKCGRKSEGRLKLRNCGVLYSRLVSVLWASVDNRTKQTLGRAVSPVYWVYECRESSCEFVFGATTPGGPGPPHSRGFQITHSDTTQSVGLLWTSDQLVAQTSTWQHTTLTTDRHPCLRWDSNPQSQQARGRKSHALELAAPGTGNLLWVSLEFRVSLLFHDIFVNRNWVATRWQQYSTHLHTNNTQNDTKQTIEQHKNFGRVRAVPGLCGFYPGICLTTGEKARENLRQGSRRVPAGTMKIHKHTIIIYRHKNKNT